MRFYLVVILIFLSATFGFTQSTGKTDSINVLKRQIIDGDTAFISQIPEIRVYPEDFYKNWFNYKKYQRLIRNVKAAYPYSKIAGKVLVDLNKDLMSISSEKKRKTYIQQTENQLRKQFESALRNLTITQGRILIKLIHRETGNTTFDILKELKGGFSAGFWQVVARIFGNNLKSKYDPYGEDVMIEIIIMMIETGQL